MYALAKCALVIFAAVAATGFELGSNDVIFHLFTRLNSGVSEPLLANVNSITSSNFFSLSRRTIFTIHNFKDSAAGNFNAFIIPAHLSEGDVNLIAIDWSVGASMYSQGLGNAPQVGLLISNFINILTSSFSYNPNLIRIVGMGLGGHIAGIAARNVNGNIPHIIAIDPSFAGWTHHPDKLRSSDAAVVEVLHATAGTLGYDYPLGTIDFYPNGGSFQNGCGIDLDCAQIYAYAFYAESITVEVNGGNKFVGTKCEDYEQAIAMQCSGDKDVTFGGSSVKSTESGIYTFSTNFVPPFAMG